MDTTLAVRQTPGGLFQVVDRMVNVGTIFYVDSNAAGAGDTVGHGRSPDAPFATLAYAITQATASKYDTIMVMPGHSETATGAGGLTFNKIGLTVIGLGRGAKQPTVLLDGAAASCLVTAAHTEILNICLSAGHADLAYAMHISALDVAVRRCKIKENIATENFLIGISVGTANNDSDRVVIEDCLFDMPDVLNTNAIAAPQGQDSAVIRNNRIVGAFVATNAPIYAAESMTNVLVEGNKIYNPINSALCGINLAGGANTGLIVRNFVQHICAAAETPFIGIGCGFMENYASGVLSTASGYLYPAADA